MSRSYTSLYCVKNLQQRNIRDCVFTIHTVTVWSKSGEYDKNTARALTCQHLSLNRWGIWTKRWKMLKTSNQIIDTTEPTSSPLLQDNAFWKDLRWVYEMQVWDVLLRFGVFGAVDFAVHQRVPCRLEERDFCSLWLTPNLALERVVVPYVLFRGKNVVASQKTNY